MNCPRCERQLSSDFNLCPYCGLKLSASQEAVGDAVGGDKTTVGGIDGSTGVAVGENNRVETTNVHMPEAFPQRKGCYGQLGGLQFSIVTGVLIIAIGVAYFMSQPRPLRSIDPISPLRPILSISPLPPTLTPTLTPTQRPTGTPTLTFSEQSTAEAEATIIEEAVQTAVQATFAAVTAEAEQTPTIIEEAVQTGIQATFAAVTAEARKIIPATGVVVPIVTHEAASAKPTPVSSDSPLSP